MTSLADMTPAQREQCIGMWVECDECKALDVGLSILDTLYEHEALLMGPNMHPHDVELESITPRWDLPRAWQADGKPVEMDVEGADYRPGTNRGFYTLDETIQKGRELPEGTTRARRFVGEWEGEWEEE